MERPLGYIGGIKIVDNPAERLAGDTAQLAEVEARIARIYDEFKILAGCLTRLERCRDGLTRRIEENLGAQAVPAVVEVSEPEPVIAGVPEPEPMVIDTPADRPVLQLAV